MPRKRREAPRNPNPNVTTLEQAIKTALENLPIQRMVMEIPVGYRIVVRNGSHHVYNANAWERPASLPLLPWSAPVGDPVADVAVDGTVTLLATTA
jgi:hypothetical protein